MKKLTPALLGAALLLSACSGGPAVSTPAGSAASDASSASVAPATPGGSAGATQSNADPGALASAVKATSDQRAELKAAILGLGSCDFTKKASEPTSPEATQCVVNGSMLNITAGILYAQLGAEAAKPGTPALVAETQAAIKPLMDNGAAATNCYASGEKCAEAKLYQDALKAAKTKLDAWPN